MAGIQARTPRTDLHADCRADPQDALADPAQSGQPQACAVQITTDALLPRSLLTQRVRLRHQMPHHRQDQHPGQFHGRFGMAVGSAHDHALRLRGGDIDRGIACRWGSAGAGGAAWPTARRCSACACASPPVSRHPASAVTSASPVWGVVGVGICTASPAYVSAPHRRAGTNRRTRLPPPGSRRESRRSAAWSCPSSAAMTIRLHGGVLYRQLRQTPARRACVAGRRRSQALNRGQKENPAA